MKKRWDELNRCREITDGALSAKNYRLQFKQLYHDREEVTGLLQLVRK